LAIETRAQCRRKDWWKEKSSRRFPVGVAAAFPYLGEVSGSGRSLKAVMSEMKHGLAKLQAAVLVPIQCPPVTGASG